MKRVTLKDVKTPGRVRCVSYWAPITGVVVFWITPRQLMWTSGMCNMVEKGLAYQKPSCFLAVADLRSVETDPKTVAQAIDDVPCESLNRAGPEGSRPSLSGCNIHHTTKWWKT